MNLLEEALRYLEVGLKPIPVVPRNKMPAAAEAGKPVTRQRPLANWREFQQRSPTEAEVTSWFEGEENSFNIGTVIPSRIIVLDFDGGKDAEKLLNDAGITLPENTPRVRSGSGGYHAYLALPDDVRDFAKIPGKNFLHATDAKGEPCKPFVEVLTINNFVVLPPSTHPNGKAYEWVVEFDTLPEVPAPLMALINAKRGATAPATATTKTAKAGKNEPGWVEELSKGVEYGSIDDSLTKLAGHYLRKRLSVANVVDILASGFGSRCTQNGKPFIVPRKDIDRVVASIQRSEAQRGTIDESEFQLLGYDHDCYYYLSRATGQVVQLSARAHDKNNLLRVASLRYWESKYGGEHGIAWAAAQAALLDAQHKIGIFDEDRFRGRGAWWDEEKQKAVMHTGGALIADGVATPIKQVPLGRYVYELSKPLNVDIGDPLSADSARSILEIFESLSWEHPHHARLAAGWCVVATICGGVDWRPHIWISGPSGSGKSWTVDHLVKRLLGNLALSAQSTTTEAGLRQTLGHDARPVIFDEAEAEGQRDDARMANVLGLIRQASSETGGAILKGSADGSARSYRIRSCFAMSSINVSAYQAADKNRISILEMKVDESRTQAARDAHFKELVSRVSSTLTDPFVAGFRARCIRMIPVIRENARVFSFAASSAIGSKRLGDQVGTLLAGCYALISDEPVTAELAADLIKDQDLSQQRALQAVSDERELLEHLLQSLQRVPMAHGAAIDRSIASLCRIAQGQTDAVGAPDAAEALALLGIKTNSDAIVIANSHRGIKRLLEGTHWGRDWSRVLLRLPGAKLSGVVRIGDITCRGVAVPWEVFE